MENHTLEAETISQLESTPSSQPPATKPQKSKALILILSFIAILSLIAVSAAAYFYLQTQTLKGELAASSPLTTKNTPESSEKLLTTNETASTINYINFPADPQNRLLYLKRPDPNQNLIQTWLINPDGSYPKQLIIPDLSMAYKIPQLNTLMYTKTDNPNNIYFYNLETNSTQQIDSLFEVPSNVNIHTTLTDLDNISPDGNYLVLQVDFYGNDCVYEIPEGFQGGFGPCPVPDDFKQEPGYYLLDVKKESLHQIPNTAHNLSWDLKNSALYYSLQATKQNGLFKLNLNTNQTDLVSSTKYFGYGARMLSNGTIIEISGSTGNDPDTSISESKLEIIRPNQEPITLDSGKWADIQSFISVDPTEQFAIYSKTNRNINGRVFADLYLINLNTLETKIINPESTELSYLSHGIWYNNHYITMVDTIETDGYTNVNNYLVSFDIPSSKMTRITPNDDIYRFTRP